MWFFCLVHVSSFIICLYFLYTFINWHLNYFLYIVYVYDINLLIFCQCSNQPLIYPKIDLPYSGSVVKTKIPLIVKVVVSKNLYSCFDRLSDIVLYLTWVSMNTPFLLTITSGTELLSEHVHLNHQIFMKQLSPQQQFLLLRLFSPDSDTLCPEDSSHGSNIRFNARDALFWLLHKFPCVWQVSCQINHCGADMG